MTLKLKENAGWMFALVLVGFAVYVCNLHNPLFWDDADWILNNPAVHALTWANIKFLFSHDALAGIGQVSNYYRPFLFLTFLANYLISGAAPVSYHVVNNAIHIASGLLVFYLGLRWLKRPRAAFLAALLFIIHPLQTEAVTYINSRGDSLSVFLMLCALVAYLHTRQGSGARRVWWWLGSLAAAVLAILSKETAAMFPAYLLVGLVAFEYTGPLWPRITRSLGAVWPFVAISAGYGLLRLTILNFQNTLNFYTQANVYSSHITVRLYTFCHVLLIYLRLLAWPTGLHMDRDVPVSLSLWSGWAWLGALVMLALAGWLVWLYRRRSLDFPVWLWGTGVFFLALGPTSGIVPINARIYEHWLYFSMVGAAFIIGFYLDRLLSLIEKKKAALLPAVVIVLIGYFGFLGIQSIRRNLLWGDTQAFYENILFYEPGDVRVLNNLGNWDSDHGDAADAQKLYEQAIATDPTQPAPYHNIGNILRDQGDTAGAITWYQKAIAADPRFHYAYENIASIYLSQNRIADALAILEKLQQVAPSDINAQRIELLKQHL